MLAVYERVLHRLSTQPDPCWPDYLQWTGGTPNTSDNDDDGVPGSTCDNCATAAGDPSTYPVTIPQVWRHPSFNNPWQEDYDGDGIGDACDHCPKRSNPANPTSCSQSPDQEQKAAPSYILTGWTETRANSMGQPAGRPIHLAELHIYGSGAQGRVGMYTFNELRRDTLEHHPNLAAGNYYARPLLNKQYELKDHLGNVRVVITDLKKVVGSNWNVDEIAWNNYYPFGMLQPQLHGNTGAYRYGFNGKEMDNEMRENPVTGESGVGNHYDYGFRVYDPRIAKFLSVDPLTANFVAWSPYAYAMNRPVDGIDLEGAEWKSQHKWSDKIQDKSLIKKLGENYTAGMTYADAYRYRVKPIYDRYLEASESRGFTCDCADLAIRGMIEYAAFYKLPVHFSDYKGEDPTFDNDDMQYKTWEDLADAVGGAYGAGDLHSDKSLVVKEVSVSEEDGKFPIPGNIITYLNNDASHHVQTITDLTKEVSGTIAYIIPVYSWYYEITQGNLSGGQASEVERYKVSVSSMINGNPRGGIMGWVRRWASISEQKFKQWNFKYFDQH